MSMVQFNLLPDVKIAYIKAQKQRNFVISVSFIASVISIIVLIIWVSTAYIVQKKSISDLTKDIESSNTKLMETKDLTKVLTVQNQLNSLTALHDAKFETSRMFNYITEITPSDITISQMDTDFLESSISISGNAPSLAAVNTFADALKFTQYETAKDSEKKNAFSEVVLSNFSISEKEDPKYTLTAKFDPILFSQTEEVKLTVPSMITTRSAVERPDSLFRNGGR